MKDKKVASVTGPDTFRLLVNYDLKVRELIRDGEYEWVHNKITSRNFPTKKTGQREIRLRLFHLDKSITGYKIIEEMNKRGYRPAELHELLALGAKLPEEQRRYDIIALGSLWKDDCFGDLNVVYLYGFNRGREVGLTYFYYNWETNNRFLAVRKY